MPLHGLRRTNKIDSLPEKWILLLSLWLSCASLCFVCPVYSRAYWDMKYFLEVTCHIRGRLQCQHSGFAGPLLKGIHPNWTSPSSFSLGNCSRSVLSVARVPLSITQELCFRQIFRNRYFAHMLSLPGCLSFLAESAPALSVPLFQSLFVPKRSTLLYSFSFFHLSWTRTSPYMLFPPEKPPDLLPVLVTCTNCSPETLISKGNSPLEKPGARNTRKHTAISITSVTSQYIWLDL